MLSFSKSIRYRYRYRYQSAGSVDGMYIHINAYICINIYINRFRYIYIDTFIDNMRFIVEVVDVFFMYS